MPDNSENIAKRWDSEYNNDRYMDEKPVKFVDKILNTLQENPKTKQGYGLYVGCGNGRNYIPLVKTGLNLYGLDISPVAIKQLSDYLPNMSDKFICKDFLEFEPKSPFDYLVAIQVFQHGSQEKINSYFKKAYDIMKTDGLLFLRVNSASTDVYHNHIITEQNDLGGFTVKYKDGPKKDLPIHFFSKEEILKSTDKLFTLLDEPYEDVNLRSPPKTGSWSQLELVLRKK